MKNTDNVELNENFDLSKFKNLGNKSTIDTDLTDMFKSTINNSSNKKSLIDELQQLPDEFIGNDQLSVNDELQEIPEESINAQIVPEQQIIMPKSIIELEHDNVVQKNLIDKKVAEAAKRLELRNKKKLVVNQEPALQQLSNQQLINDYQQITGKDLPDNVNLEYIVDTVGEIIDEIPDLPADTTIGDFELVNVSDKKDKTGYKKTKVSILSKVGSKDLSKLATVVKNESGGVVLHRVADIRLIGNTNKIKLKGFPLKLLKQTYTFKPKGGSVNKEHRIMLSIADDFESDKKAIIFIQSSRNKYVCEVDMYDDEDIQWLGKFMAYFFRMDFSLAVRKLKFRGTNDPLVPVMTQIIKTHDFRVAPTSDPESNVTLGFKIITTGTKNQWLAVGIRKAMKGDTYYINVMSKVDKNWRHNIELKSKAPITLKYLMSSEFIERLYSLYEEDWTKFGVDFETPENKELFLINKLTYKFLKQAFMEIYDLEIADEKLGIKIGETFSKNDTKAATNKDYQAEAILGKTVALEYFILTYLGVEVVGGDSASRFSEKLERNYNSRVFMFQLEYSIEGEKSKIQAKTFEEIKERSQFLTIRPNIITS